MKSFSVVASIILCFSTTFAAPAPAASPAFDKERAADRIRKFKQDAILKNMSVPDADSVSSNWGGAQLSVPGASAIQASLNVPSVSFASSADGSEEYYGCAWIGIDGYNCEGLWQAGAYWEAPGNGAFSYHAFYEWYPAGVIFTDMTVSPGDTLSVSVVADSTTSGTVTITDTTTGQSATESLSNQYTLCQTSVEWIVEDNLPSENPYADFGSVTFTGAQYSAGGNSGNAEGANIIDMNNNGVTWTSCSASGSTVTCNWQD